MAKGLSRRKSNGEGSVFQSSDGRWRGFITIGYSTEGKQVKKWRRGRTKRDVIEKLNQIAAQSGSRLISSPEKVTVEEWLRRYAELRGSEVRPSTRRAHTHYLSKILPGLGHMQIAKVTALQVRGFYRSLVESGLSPSVRQHIHHFLRGAFQDALRMGLVERNVLDAVDAPKGGRITEAKSWTSAEVVAFMEAARSERFFGAFYLMLSQGLRIGETLALRWDDLEGERLTVQRTVSFVTNRPAFGPPKTKRGFRVLYLHQDALAVLSEHRALQALERDTSARWHDHGLMFCSAVGTPLNINNVRRTFRKVIERAGVRYIRIHDLRHTYITMARDAGIDAEVVAQRAGQDVRVTLTIYSKVTEERKRKAALSLDALAGLQAGTFSAPTLVSTGNSEPRQMAGREARNAVQNSKSDSGVLKRKIDKSSSHARGRRFNPCAAHHKEQRVGREKPPTWFGGFPMHQAHTDQYTDHSVTTRPRDLADGRVCWRRKWLELQPVSRQSCCS